MIVELRFRRATTVEWESVDPILSDGEPGYDKTTRRFKIGDGVSHWTALGYQTVSEAQTAALVAAADGIDDILAQTLAARDEVLAAIDDLPAGGGTNAEEVRGLIGTTVTAGTGMSVVVNDPADTVTVGLSTATQDTLALVPTAVQSASLVEQVEDIVGNMMVSGANVTLSYNDTTGKLTVTAAGGDAEVMRDTIGAALVGTSGIGVAVNDAADTITFTITAVTISQVTGLLTALNAKAPLDSPALTGTPTTTTPAAGDNSTKIANTAFVATAINAARPAESAAYKAGFTNYTTLGYVVDPDLQITLGVGKWIVPFTIFYAGHADDDGRVDFNFTGTATCKSSVGPHPGSGAAAGSFTTVTEGTQYSGTQNVTTGLDFTRQYILGCNGIGVEVSFSGTLKINVTVAGTLRVRAQKNTNTQTVDPFRITSMSDLSAIAAPA